MSPAPVRPLVRLDALLAVALVWACPACSTPESSTTTRAQPDPRVSPGTGDGPPVPAEHADDAADPHAAALLVDALGQLSTNPTLLADDVDQAHARLGLGEQFTLHRYADGRDDGRVGFSIRPTGAPLDAASMAEALGLDDADRLAASRETTIAWGGLELDIELDRRAVSELRVLPAP